MPRNRRPPSTAAAGICAGHQSTIKRRTTHVLSHLPLLRGEFRPGRTLWLPFPYPGQSAEVECDGRRAGAQPQEVCPCPHLGSAVCLTASVFFRWLPRAVVLFLCGQAGKRDRQSAGVHYPAAFPGYAPLGGYHADRRRQDTARGYRHVRLALSKPVHDRRAGGLGGK